MSADKHECERLALPFDGKTKVHCAGQSIDAFCRAIVAVAALPADATQDTRESWHATVLFCLDDMVTNLNTMNGQKVAVSILGALAKIEAAAAPPDTLDVSKTQHNRTGDPRRS